VGADLTRRQFLKETISKTTFLGLGGVGCFGIGSNSKHIAQCGNCGSVNITSSYYFSSFISFQEPIYCHRCGVNLATLSFDIRCDKSCRFYQEKPNGKGNHPIPYCVQIPFPNYNYLKTKRKTFSSLKNLQL
jgi:hypothetical protein